MKKTHLLVAAALGVLPVGSATGAAAHLHAQDVEMLGRVYGTRPPAAYYAERERDPGAFRFERGLTASRREVGVRGESGMPMLRSDRSGPARALGQRDGAVRGTFHIPVLLGLFADSDPVPPFTRAHLQAQFFDGPNPTGTITELYREMSGGLAELRGETQEWGRSTLTRAQVTGGVSGLGGSSRVGQFIIELLAQVEGVDWGRYDSDGPDGVPNSGDDDGYVDVLAVIHPTSGAECTGRGDVVWSHKWGLQEAIGQEYVTSSPAASGGWVRVDDYTIQPAFSCTAGRINEIGVFAHELGHGFGLPDLYDTGSFPAQAGTGRWDLMGTGSWGCSALFQPERPCHMGAWSKAALGWVEVDGLAPGADLGTLSLDPVIRAGRVIRIDAGDGSGEYFLLENRQRIGFDASLPAPGLLVWQIDPGWIDSRWAWNGVNEADSHLGVWLRQADGLNELALSQGGDRGDAGDPFPGTTGNSAFHAGSRPASFSHGGAAAGVTLTGIRLEGETVRFEALTRYQSLRVASAGDAGLGGLLTVDGARVATREVTVRSAPFQTHTLEAAGGEPITEGVRRGFVRWEDDAGAPRTRTWTTGLIDARLVATYGPRQVRFGLTVEGARFDVEPGAVVATPSSPDLWFEEGTEVALRADPTRGFAFRQWKGALAGLPNPTVVLMDAPRDATAVFELVFAVDAAPVSLPAATPQQIALQANDANDPVVWTMLAGALPVGLTLESDGVLRGAALETGTFPLQVEARDAAGLRAAATLTLEVTVPVIGMDVLAAPFFLRPAGLDPLQILYLDRAGNRNGSYDLGDFRAYVVANPGAPATARRLELEPRVVPLIDFGREGSP